MDFNKNYYNILGVDKNASIDDIKKVFRKKANETHPDKHGGDDGEFKKINEAYQVIGDKRKKSEYDAKSPHGKNYNPSNFNSMFDFFGSGDGFGFSFSNGFDPFEMFFNRKKEFYENLDIKINIDVTMSDIYNNNDIKVNYKRNIRCDRCNGTGFDPDSESHQCDVCDGSGKVWEPVSGYISCKYCQGTGRIHTEQCTKCNGDKVIPKDEEFSLSNIYRIDRSDTKYLGGYGHYSRYYRNKVGNLVLNIIYHKDSKYNRRPDGLYYKLDVHFEDAIKGKKMIYNHLDGKDYEITIPEKTKDGDKLRLKGKGMLVDGGLRQDMFLVVNVMIDYSRV